MVILWLRSSKLDEGILLSDRRLYSLYTVPGGFEFEFLSQYREIDAERGILDRDQPVPVSDRRKLEVWTSQRFPDSPIPKRDLLGFAFQNSNELLRDGLGWPTNRIYTHSVRAPAMVRRLFIFLSARTIGCRLAPPLTIVRASGDGSMR